MIIHFSRHGLTIGTKLGIKYAWELTLINKVRSFNDGITFFKCDINLDLFGSHKPTFGITLNIMNVNLIEFNFYNINHKED